MKRPKYVRVGDYSRKLTVIEACEFRAHVRACINALSRAQMGVPPLRTALQAGLSAGLLFSSMPECEQQAALSRRFGGAP